MRAPILALLPMCASSVAVAGSGATFSPLPDLEGGAFSCAALGVSADGSTIVGHGTSSARSEAVRWRQGVAEPLGVLPDRPSTSYATECSGDGSIVVGASGSFPSSLAFRWEAGGMTPIPVLAGSSSNAANGISRDGRVIAGWAYSGTAFTAFRFEDNLLTMLFDIPGGSNEDSAVSAAVSADGSIIAGRGVTVGHQYEACRWESPSQSAIAMGDLPGGQAWSEIDAMNGSGSVMVGYANSAQQSGGFYGEAARWVENGPPQSLGDLPGGFFNGYAFGVSDSGETIIGYSHTALGNEAFIWDPVNGMRNLRIVLETEHAIDLTGWTLTSARGVSADGRTIVGTGVNPKGQAQGWVVCFVPPVCEGDANGDGVVNFADVTNVLAFFGSDYTPGTGMGDADHNGPVNFADVTSVLTNFGLMCR